MAKFKEVTHNPGHFMFDCPGCHMAHEINTNTGNNEPVWGFNFDMEKPTVTPFIRVRWPERGVEKTCHSYVTNGRIEFLSDCTHELAGKTVELPDF